MNLWRALRIDECPRPCVISLVGAGGKSTLLARLATEAQELDVRVLVTSTTHLWRAQFDAVPHHALIASVHDALIRARAGPFPLALARSPQHTGEEDVFKVVGLPPEWIDVLAEEENADLIIVEADGSRERPLKAPASHEPVVPTSTHLFVAIAGWQGVGKPLTEEYVHRPEIFARLARLAPRELISADALVRVLLHPQGGLKGKPPQARAVAVLNQLDAEDALKAARPVARRLVRQGEGRISEVLLTAFIRSEPVHEVHGRVGAVILAAGGATRFGRAKQVIPWRGKPLIAHVLDATAEAEVDEIVVVLGAYRQQVEAAVNAWMQTHRGNTPVRIVINREWQQGQSTSVRAGLNALGPVHAALFPLADQPRVPPNLLNALIHRHRRTLASIVVPRYNERPGAPVLFDRRLFTELKRLEGDTGGRALVRRFAHQVDWLDWTDDRVALDVDTPEDLQRLG